MHHRNGISGGWGWGGGGENLGGSLDFWENKRGDQSLLRTQKGGSLKTLEGFRGWGPLKLKNDVIGGGLPKSSKVNRGDHLSEVTFKGGIG